MIDIDVLDTQHSDLDDTFRRHAFEHLRDSGGASGQDSATSAGCCRSATKPSRLSGSSRRSRLLRGRTRACSLVAVAPRRSYDPR